jgi:hypothetical protein
MTGDFGDWDALLRSWGRSMRARNLAARTIELYTTPAGSWPTI